MAAAHAKRTRPQEAAASHCPTSTAVRSNGGWRALRRPVQRPCTCWCWTTARGTKPKPCAGRAHPGHDMVVMGYRKRQFLEIASYPGSCTKVLKGTPRPWPVGQYVPPRLLRKHVN